MTDENNRPLIPESWIPEIKRLEEDQDESIRKLFEIAHHPPAKNTIRKNK